VRVWTWMIERKGLDFSGTDDVSSTVGCMYGSEGTGHWRFDSGIRDQWAQAFEWAAWRAVGGATGLARWVYGRYLLCVLLLLLSSFVMYPVFPEKTRGMTRRIRKLKKPNGDRKHVS